MNNIKLIPQNLDFNQAQNLLSEFSLNTSKSRPFVGAEECAVVIKYLSGLLEHSRDLLKQAKDFGIDSMSIEDRAQWEGKVEASISMKKSLSNIPLVKSERNNVISIFK